MGTRDDVPVEQVSITNEDAQGPTIQLAFENNATQVTPGSTLTASIEDESGINVLGSKAVNSILLEFDESGFPIDLTSQFSLDPGEFTKGTLQYEIPSDLSPGEHTVTVSAADMLENVTVVEIRFEVIASGNLEIANHVVYPNPFREDTRFVVEVTGEGGATVELTVYTVDGKAVQRLTDQVDGNGGAMVIPWDGRDLRGDEVANGVYLYTVRASFAEPGISEVVTGRVVRMR